ncbi:acetyl-CoA carboxylase carboxyltransferase subunit beta [bacterium]|nr:acetyl-CoA carboxylase carboxyltransferase subunit beta [bacterium]
MVIFKDRKTPGIKGPKEIEGKNPVVAPQGFWVKCPECSEILQQPKVGENLDVCPECEFHFRISARRRIELLCDPGAFVEKDTSLLTTDILEFSDSQKYPDRLKASRSKTRLNDAFVSGEGKVKGRSVQIGVFEFSFMGGSMGMVVGEKIARVFDRGTKKKQPVVLVLASGGARMQEGIMSLMQMAKTVAALNNFRKKQVPYIPIFTHPTTGGVAASFAFLGDVNIAEPNALIGFAGPRVIQQTLSEKLPPKFQRSEFLLEHGMLDGIVHRKELRPYLDRVLGFLMD